MMYRKISLLTLLVCVVSLFLYPFVAAADMPNDVRTKETLVNNAFPKVTTAVNNYNAIKSAMQTLNGQWSSNEKKVAKGTDVTVTITAGAIISAAVAVVSGGSLAPAAFAAAIAAKTAAQTASTSWTSQKYVSAMGTTLSAMDSARSEVQTKYNTYSSRYGAYIKACADHSLVRFTAANVKTSVYTSGQLDYAVNASGVDSGYYHSSASSSSATDHAILQKETYKHWETQPLGYGDYHWNTVALPSDYTCKGSCTVGFRSAAEAFSAHRVVCGIIDRETFSSGGKTSFDDSIAPCQRNYYTCKRSTCPDAQYHVDDNGDDTENPIAAPPNNGTPPDDNITYACDDHSGPSSGSSGHTAASCGTSDHSLSASELYLNGF